MDDYSSILRKSFNLKLMSCLLLVVFADILFYGESVGWTLGLFMLVAFVASIAHTQRALNNRIKIFLALLVIVQCLLMINNPEVLSFILCVVGVASFHAYIHDRWQDNGVHWLSTVMKFISLNIFRFGKDVRTLQRMMNLSGDRYNIWGRISGWVLPITFLIIFGALFSSANPVFQGWLEAIDLSIIWNLFSFPRIIFWLLTASIIWIILRPYIKYRIANHKIFEFQFNERDNWLFSRRAVIRSLIMFNMLFAVQTGMDFMYLWGGVSLPQSMSYAEYAHRGAYPLVGTALLAGLFVIIANRPGSEDAKSSLLKGLVYLWIVQNIILVISSVWRNALYVEVYSLTYLRVAAFVWMLLVVIGLIFIIIRIHQNKSDLWLFNVNIMSLFSVLIVCSFFNFAGIIADYNVRNNREITGKGDSLDVMYLRQLGTSSLPSIKWYKENLELGVMHATEIEEVEHFLKSRLKSRTSYWRQWTYQDYRIQQKITRTNSD